MPKKFDYSTPYTNSKHGTRGVSYDATRNSWIAKISYQGKRTTLGRFDTKEEAEAAYQAVASTIRIRAEQDDKNRKQHRIDTAIDLYR